MRNTGSALGFHQVGQRPEGRGSRALTAGQDLHPYPARGWHSFGCDVLSCWECKHRLVALATLGDETTDSSAPLAAALRSPPVAALHNRCFADPAAAMRRPPVRPLKAPAQSVARRGSDEQLQGMGDDVEHGVEALDRSRRRPGRVEDERLPSGAGDRRATAGRAGSPAASPRPARGLAVEDVRVPSGVRSRAEPGAAGRDDEPGEADRHRFECAADGRPSVLARHGARRRRSPRRSAARRGQGPSGPPGCRRPRRPTPSAPSLRDRHPMRSQRECVSRGAGAARTSRRCPASCGSSSATSPVRRPWRAGRVERLRARDALRRRCSSTPSVSAAVSVHTLYTSTPPGATSCTAASTSSVWSVARRSTSSGCTRQRASGRRRSTPRPEHGASTSTRSKHAGAKAAGVPSAGHDEQQVGLERLDVRDHRPRLGSARTSDATTQRARRGKSRRLAAGRRAQVGDPLAGLRLDEVGHPLRRLVLDVAVGALRDRGALVHRARARRARRRAPRSAMSRSTIQSG